MLHVAGMAIALLRWKFHKNVDHAWSAYRGWLIMVPLLAVSIFLGRGAAITFFTLVAAFGFKEFADAESKLVGDCTSSVYYDHFGNGVQYTREGMLFWQKDSNTIYFYRAASVWGYIQGHSQLLYGSGAI